MAGNLLTPTIIRVIGLGLGLSVWDLSNMMMGWATGHFGLFGVWREAPEVPWMNNVGFGMACLSLLLFAQAIEESPEDQLERQARQHSRRPTRTSTRGSTGSARSTDSRVHVRPGLGGGGGAQAACGEAAAAPEENHVGEAARDEEAGTTAWTSRSVESTSTEEASDITSHATGKTKRSVAEQVVGYTCDLLQARWLGAFASALLAGSLFGYTFSPSTQLMQKGKMGEPHSTNPMDYVFSNFCGIVAMAAVALLGYLLVMGPRSYTPRCIVLPAILSGIMWGVAQAAWFKANVVLSIVVAFPIVSSLPGVVGLFWGVLFFGELQSRRSRCFAAAGMLVRIPGVLLIALSAGR